MTPLLNDLDYLAELTNCLTNTLARLIQQRPPDPITFIERSLRQHRRLHPSQHQESEASNSTDSEKKTLVASPDIATAQSKELSKPEDFPGERSTAPESLKQDLHNRTLEYDDAFIENEHFDSVNLANTVHKHFKSDFRTIGDLFDDDDFG